jgi:hypothetical protein
MRKRATLERVVVSRSFSMQKPGALWMGARKLLSRPEAIEQYVILRMRVDELNRLDYLLKALKDKRITPPTDSPFSSRELADVVRTCLFGWLATLTDRDSRAVYAFDCLLNLFPRRNGDIIAAQLSLEACHDELQQFRNNVAFHSRAVIDAHRQARMKLRDDDVFLDVVSAINGFRASMERLTGEELEAIPELPGVLQQMQVSHLPAFKRVPAMTHS